MYNFKRLQSRDTFIDVNTEGILQGTKPMVTQEQINQIRLWQKLSKEPAQLKNKILWTDETKINLYQNDERRSIWKGKHFSHHLSKIVEAVLWHGCQWKYVSGIY